MRARNIKPGTFKNEVLGTRDPLLTLLFQGLWCLADRDGRLEDRPLRLRAEIFPYRENLDIDGFLSELEKLKFIHRYSLGGENYISVLNFAKHQSPHHTEKKGVIPPPPSSPITNGESNVITTLCFRGNPPDSLIPDSLIPSAEPPSDSPPAPEPIAIKLAQNDGKHFPIAQAQARNWQELYPGVDVAQQLRSMAAWLDANPKQRKTRGGMLKFCVNWLNREQDRAPRNTHDPPAKPVEAVRPRPVDMGQVLEAWMRQREREGHIVQDVGRLWRKVQDELEKEINSHSFAIWIKPLRAGYVTREGHLVLLAPSEEVIPVLIEKYGAVIVAALRRLDAELDGVVVKAVKAESLVEAASV